jgi:hypothetical protein
MAIISLDGINSDSLLVREKMNAKERLLDCPNLFAKVKPNRESGTVLTAHWRCAHDLTRKGGPPSTLIQAWLLPEGLPEIAIWSAPSLPKSQSGRFVSSAHCGFRLQARTSVGCFEI